LHQKASSNNKVVQSTLVADQQQSNSDCGFTTWLE